METLLPAVFLHLGNPVTTVQSLFKCRIISSSSSLLYKNFEKNLKSSTFLYFGRNGYRFGRNGYHFGQKGHFGQRYMTVSAKKGHFGLCCPGRNDHLPCCTAKFLNNSTIFKVFNVSYLNRGSVKKKRCRTIVSRKQSMS